MWSKTLNTKSEVSVLGHFINAKKVWQSLATRTLICEPWDTLLLINVNDIKTLNLLCLSQDCFHVKGPGANDFTSIYHLTSFPFWLPTLIQYRSNFFLTKKQCNESSLRIFDWLYWLPCSRLYIFWILCCYIFVFSQY